MLKISECSRILQENGIECSLEHGCVEVTFYFEPEVARERGFVFPDTYMEGGYTIEGWFVMLPDLSRQHSEVVHDGVKDNDWSRQVMILGDFIEVGKCSRRKCMNLLVEKLTKHNK